MSFETNDLGLEYPRLLYLLNGASIQETRGGRTKEHLDFHLTLLEPENCVVTRKGFSKRFMIEEIEQLLAGVHDNSRLKKITPQAAALITPKTAYGPRTWRQMLSVEKELQKDPLSRRAVVYVGSERDLGRISSATAGEMPCTCLWQFFLRDGKLSMQVTMRSWDAVWGLGYDVPSFVAVQMALARALDVELGAYSHHAGSFHIYERHWDLYPDDVSKQLKLPWLRPSIADTQAAAKLRLL